MQQHPTGKKFHVLPFSSTKNRTANLNQEEFAQFTASCSFLQLPTGSLSHRTPVPNKALGFLRVLRASAAKTARPNTGAHDTGATPNQTNSE